MGARTVYAEAARQLGETMARSGLGLVYGGSHVGLMGVVADAVLNAGGEAIGVIPDFMVNKELAHTGLTELHIVGSMHERKARMAELSDAFIALPGGMGTFEEFCEIVTWAQLGMHQKPCGLLNVEGFYDPFLALVDSAIESQFIRESHRSLVLHSPTVDGLLAHFSLYTPPAGSKWLDRDQI
jgi:uncharacterized protein (TIGR00730 family)